MPRAAPKFKGFVHSNDWVHILRSMGHTSHALLMRCSVSRPKRSFFNFGSSVSDISRSNERILHCIIIIVSEQGMILHGRRNCAGCVGI